MRALFPSIKKYWIYLVLFVFSVVIFLIHYSIAGQAVYGDGIDYWAYLHTWYFDHDMDFTNEYEHIYNHEFNNAHPESKSPVIVKTNVTKLGKTDDIHPYGTALFFLPFFMIADGIVVIANLFHIGLLRNGYSDTYQIIVGMGSIIYTFLGLVIMEYTCVKLGVGEKIARLSTLTLFGASTLLYYGSFDVINSHGISLFLLSVFWYLLFIRASYSIRRFAAYGVLMGLAFVVRLQEALLAVPLTLVSVRALWPNFPKLVKLCVVTGIVGLLVVFPLFYQWHVLYGGWLHSSYFDGFAPTPLVGSLFDAQNGLFTKTPLIFLIVMVTPIVALCAKKYRFLMGVFSLFFVLQVVLLARHGGWIGAAYGGRMYINCTFAFVLIFALLLERSQKGISYRLLRYFCVFFIVYNMMSIGDFVLFEKMASGNKIGSESITKVKIERLLHFQY
ncbi:hypothetical protein C5B42_01285 [Candidatus Cerribacteria bacterium 'Amazon FNV 2010 28 9']|uniref:Glycosyltransferase RgtA/B/C/D-like domain-containing protein n=1 Tax=Candidatus Cerribacteria bacterium 'Amazon FNV 2010 28 9' TaxID=2081795 RepID=A0A317JPJ9_9BACT|nr:MAG: hypothetical protein C5B42_01285 [Candidatus Cerribacteria bacterium 'Amazon FNV 2010 28 9']